MKRYVIERDIPKVGSLSREEYRKLAATSNAALAKLVTEVPIEIGPMTAYSN
jgi:hypothetical protein